MEELRNTCLKCNETLQENRKSVLCDECAMEYVMLHERGFIVYLVETHTQKVWKHKQKEWILKLITLVLIPISAYTCRINLEGGKLALFWFLIINLVGLLYFLMQLTKSTQRLEELSSEMVALAIQNSEGTTTKLLEDVTSGNLNKEIEEDYRQGSGEING